MGKVLKIAAVVAAIAVNVIPGAGQAISGAIFGTLTGAASIGTFAAAAFTFSQVAVQALTLYGVTSGLKMAAKAAGLGPKPPKLPPASQDRLRAGLDPRAFRKIVFGHTATAVDVRYQEFTGADQEFLNSVIALSSHQLHSIEEIWFDEKLAWSASGGVASEFSGYLWVQVIPVGAVGSSFGIPGSSSWTATNSRLIGCGYIWLRYKLIGNTKKAESPFGSTVTSRITVRARAALVYDPRRDSTQPGGSGTHRADNQSSWAWVSDDVGRNPALQLLWYLLGWRIQNPVSGAWKLAVGLGLPPERIDLASFMAAANLCDEPVSLAAGGTEPRYRSDGVFSEGDDPSVVFENLLGAMNGVLRDAGGKLVLAVLHNDLATPLTLGPGDIVSEFTWMQTPPIEQCFNVVRGQYVDASDAGLYQMADFPEVSIVSPDGIERASTPMQLAMVQASGQAQRLAKQYLQRAQYPGTFTATFLASAWRCEVGSIVALTFPALGFEDKLFRVIEHTIALDGTCPMVLREEDATIYSWDDEDEPAVTGHLPVSYNPLNDPFVQAIGQTDSDLADLAAQMVAIGEELEGIAGDIDDFDPDNNGNSLTPPAPTGVAITGTIFIDSTGQAKVVWNYTPSSDPNAAANIDGYIVLLLQRESSAGYTFNPADIGSMRRVVIDDPTVKVAYFNGTPVQLWDTAIVIPFRKVNFSVNASGIVYGTPAQSSATTPYRMASAPRFNGLIAGLVDLSSSDVVAYSNRAAAAIRSDFMIGDDRVGRDAILADAISATDYVAQLGTTALGEADDAVFNVIFGVEVDETGRLHTRLVLPYYLTKIGPTLGATYTLNVRIHLWDPISAGEIEQSPIYQFQERWDAASSGVVKNFEQRVAVIEHYFSGIEAMTYDVGYTAFTPFIGTTNEATLPPTRFLYARVPKADS